MNQQMKYKEMNFYKHYVMTFHLPFTALLLLTFYTDDVSQETLNDLSLLLYAVLLARLTDVLWKEEEIPFINRYFWFEWQ